MIPATSGSATTVIDARKHHSVSLNLTHSRLTETPDCASLTSLTAIDLTDNCIGELTLDDLPPGLKQLTVTGCGLDALPSDLSRLVSLERLFAGANR